MKKATHKKKILRELEKVPIVNNACANANVSRQTFYRWKKEDKEFDSQIKEAISKGEDYINDMAENQLIQNLKSNYFPAIRFWLKSRHKKFKKEYAQEQVVEEYKMSEEELEARRRAIRNVLGSFPEDNDET